MNPEAFFYLVDIETGEPLAIFSTDNCRSMIELNSLEGRIRAEHNVDDPASGLALRESVSAPLPADTIRRVLATMRTR